MFHLLEDVASIEILSKDALSTSQSRLKYIGAAIMEDSTGGAASKSESETTVFTGSPSKETIS